MTEHDAGGEGSCFWAFVFPDAFIRNLKDIEESLGRQAAKLRVETVERLKKHAASFKTYTQDVIAKECSAAKKAVPKNFADFFYKRRLRKASGLTVSWFKQLPRERPRLSLSGMLEPHKVDSAEADRLSKLQAEIGIQQPLVFARQDDELG